MNITRVEIGTLNEELKVSLTPADYSEQVENELKKVRRNMTLPGFRTGHVPAGIVKKRYGKAVLLEELNKIVSGSLQNFIRDSNLDLLGSPIPRPADENVNNFETPGDFEFVFEIGLAPQFQLTLPPSKTFDQYVIKTDDAKVNDYITDLRRKYGKFSNPETSDADTIFYGDFTELDGYGNAKEGGITNRSTLSVAMVKDDTIRQQLVGRVKGAVVKLNLQKAFGADTTEIGHMLNRSPEEATAIQSDFNYLIDTINRVELADMNQEFFDKIYGEGAVTTEDEFRNKVREQLDSFYMQDSDFKLKHDIEDHLLAELDLKLPDSFLRKWLSTEVEKPLSEEQLEKEYPSYSRGMKLRLIENRIFRDQQMQINQEELRGMARQYIMHQFSGYAYGLTDDIMDSLINRYLEKRESVDRIVENLSSRKVFDYLKSVVKLNPKQVSYEEFVNIAKSH
ncbi:MAG: trigger factor, partial [Bacteroidota bacterium]